MKPHRRLRQITGEPSLVKVTDSGVGLKSKVEQKIYSSSLIILLYFSFYRGNFSLLRVIRIRIPSSCTRKARSMADDTDLASVLAAVLSTAQRHNFGTATTPSAKSSSSTMTSSDTTKTQNAIELPSACKMKILSVSRSSTKGLLSLNFALHLCFLWKQVRFVA